MKCCYGKCCTAFSPLARRRMRVLILFLATAAAYREVPLLYSAAHVDHSDIAISLGKINKKTERNHVWSIQQRSYSKEKKQRQFSFLQLRHKSLSRAAGIRLHDQVLVSKKLATYFADIGIGTEPEISTFRVLFDTGSCEFWVPDASCMSQQCRGHRKYRKSPTFERRFNPDGTASVMNVQYLSGSLQGYDGYDTVHLGSDISVPHTNIGFATHLDIPLLQDLEWDGIVGLGFKNNEINERGVLPFIERVVSSGVLKDRKLANQFAYYLSATGGAVTFGGVDLTKKENPGEEFSWVAVDPSNSYWTVQILSVMKASRADSYATRMAAFSDRPGGASIVDTGTYLIYSPTRVMEGYLSDLHISSCEDKELLPDLIFQFEGVPHHEDKTLVELQLSPNDYVLEFVNDEGKHECVLGIAPDDSEEEDGLHGWTLGQVFLRAYYTVFDRDNLAVGFVRSKH